MNIPNYEKFFGYLKNKGIHKIYDVSLGADITVWAYLEAIKKLQIDSMIAPAMSVNC